MAQRLRYRKQIARPAEFEYRYKDDEDRTIVKPLSEMSNKDLVEEIKKQKSKEAKWFKRSKFCGEMASLLEAEIQKRQEINQSVIS